MDYFLFNTLIYSRLKLAFFSLSLSSPFVLDKLHTNNFLPTSRLPSFLFVRAGKIVRSEKPNFSAFLPYASIINLTLFLGKFHLAHLVAFSFFLFFLYVIFLAGRILKISLNRLYLSSFSKANSGHERVFTFRFSSKDRFVLAPAKNTF